jgi:hypothetical protein
MLVAELHEWAAGVKWRTLNRYSRALTRIGQTVGSERLVYNSVVYGQIADRGRVAYPPFARILRAAFPHVRSAIDLGCGTGHLVAALRAEGTAAEGYEYAKQPRDIARRELGLTTHPFDLTQPPPLPQVDLAISIEVAEHVPPALGDVLVHLLAQHAPLIVFTAATPGQGGIGHINEQPHEYWIERFKAAGCEYLDDTTAQLAEEARPQVKVSPWIAQNLMIFRRQASLIE